MKKHTIKFILLCLLIIAIGLSVTGCGSPYSTKRISAIKLFEKRNETALNSKNSSPRTQQFLRLRFLTEQYENDPAPVIDALHQESFTSNDIEVTLALAELSFLQGRRYHKKDLEYAKAMYLTTAEGAYRYLINKDLQLSQVALEPRFRFMAELYKQAVSSLWELRADPMKISSTTARTIETATTSYTALMEPPTPPRISPEAFNELIPTNQFQVHGLTNEYISYGLGVPMVGIVQNPRGHNEWGPFFPPNRFVYPLSAFVKFNEPELKNGKRHVTCTLGFYDPLATDSIQLNGREIPLEADFSTALAFQLHKTKPLKSGLTGLLNSDKLIDNAGLYLLEPYRPEKIPVVMVHGLMSSPATWVAMFNDLRGVPELRDRYQFWFFSYPTGLPVLSSSAILRQQLKAVRDYYDPDHTNPNFDNMVLVGHSMGGLLTRMMLIDPGNTFYDAVFDEPLDQLPITEEQRKLVENLLFFKRQENIRRVIFISTPHCGSPVADTWYAKFGAGFINLPGNLVQGANSVLNNQDIQYSTAIQNQTRRIHTSIEILSPTSLFMTEQLKIPLPQDIPYHSIIGIQNAAKGPGSSDGVVPYESSHLDFTVSEKLVHSKHGAHTHPLAIAEVKRILKEHLDESDKQ